MDDERTGDGQREPLWPPDPELPPASGGATPPDAVAPAPPIEPAGYPIAPIFPPEPGFQPAQPVFPAASPAISDEATERIPAAPTGPALSDISTERMPAAPSVLPGAPFSDEDTARMAAAPQAADVPTHRLSAPPTVPPAAPVEAPPAQSPPAPVPSPPATPATSRARSMLRWIGAHWLPLSFVLVFLLIAGGALGVYNYAASLAAQPGKLVTKYCAALTSDDFQAAYNLESASFRAQMPLKQYIADASDRDAISGRISACRATPAQQLSALSFLKNPRSLLFNLSLTRGGVVEQGHLALSRDASGWAVAALSSSVSGIDLGPLHTEEALCQAFVSRDYTTAYGLLSTPYQQEQGSEKTFAGDFGSDLKITGCTPTLKGYTVDKADQRASFQVTLNVALTGDTSATTLTLPATVTLVREPGGWRVDTITPTLSQ